MDHKRVKKFLGSIETRKVSKKDFTDSVKQVLLSDIPEQTSSRNREPTKKELEQRFRLDRG